jgi:acetylornithine aminotransferase
MNLFDVYPLYSIKSIRLHYYRRNGVEYLDLYGGHGVISIGHPTRLCHSLKKQLDNISFYSNAIQNPLQVELAQNWKAFRIRGLHLFL